MTKATETPAELQALLDEINKWLKRGDKKAIAKDVNRTPEYVSDVLRNVHYNEDIIENATKRALKRKDQTVNFLNQFKAQ
jgi:hypothetical protein